VSEGEPSVPFQLGEFIADKYRVERILGAGGMGVVVEATHVDLERKVAIKLIREELAKEASITERLKLEAKAAAKIQSEHVGKVLDVGTLPSGAPYIVMEYLEGQDLCQVLEASGALRVTQAIDYVMQACEALAEAHAAHIVHRDLKPENLFVTRQPDGSSIIKVLDFGISKQLGSADRRQLTNPSTAVGSPRYMAPEQMQGGAIDVRADIWSLGAILYETLGNVPAFDSDTLPGICAQVLGQQPRQLREFAPHVPDRLAAIIMRCLSKARDDRYPNVAELAQALAPFGTERADLSRRRIAVLLGGARSVDATQVEATQVDVTQRVQPSALIDTQGQTAVVDTGAVLSAVMANSAIAPNNTVGRGIAVDVAASSQTGTAQAPRRAVWPFVVVPLATLAVAAGAFVFSNATKGDSESEPAGVPPTAAAASATNGAAEVAPPSETQARAELAVAPEGEHTEAATSATAASDSASPDVAPAPTDEDLAPIKTPRAPAPHKPSGKKPSKKSTGTESPTKKPTDAWDPNSFGGRE
jgi:serine/threonine-protein kinase